MENSELLARAQAYARDRGLGFDPDAMLGIGQDGSIWRTAQWTAIKAFRREQAYSTELACYERLRLHDVIKLCVINIGDFYVPGLIDSDDSLQVIEMDIVSPPFLLDFGKCYLDRRPDYSAEVWQQWQEDHEEMWEGRWKIVRRLVWQLERFGIYHVDPRPGNIRFGDE